MEISQLQAIIDKCGEPQVVDSDVMSGESGIVIFLVYEQKDYHQTMEEANNNL